MKIYFIFFLFLFFGNVGFAQTKEVPVNDSIVDKPAEFPGGSEGWRVYLEKNLKYPKKAAKKNIQGVVRVQFIVDKTGAVSEVAVISEPGGGLGDEVERLISTGPNWVPAEQAGKKVSYRHIQAVTFKLE